MPGIDMPDFAQLSKEQKAIIEDAEFEENFLVTGPPGTGKTVVAMWRAHQSAQYHNDPVGLFVYNNLLATYSDNWSGQSDDVKVSTYHKWVWGFWKRHFNEQPPTIPNDKWKYDWDAMLPQLLERELGLGHIILDEAQDHPNSFYEALGALDVIINKSSQTFGILADENQRLAEDYNSSIDDIKKRINKFSKTPEFLLTKNYRNTKQISWLASKFYTGLQTGIPTFPKRSGELPVAAGYKNLDEQVARIATYMKTNTNNSALVICPRVTSAKKICKKLHDELIRTKISVNGFGGGKAFIEGEPIRPSENSTVTCIHWRSMKGVEADAVFAADFHKHNYGEDGHIDEKRRFYVLASRARNYLEFMYKTSESNCAMLNLLKEHSTGEFDGKNQKLVKWK